MRQPYTRASSAVAAIRNGDWKDAATLFGRALEEASAGYRDADGVPTVQVVMRKDSNAADTALPHGTIVRLELEGAEVDLRRAAHILPQLYPGEMLSDWHLWRA